MHLTLLAVHVFLLHAIPCIAAVGRTATSTASSATTTSPLRRDAATTQTPGSIAMAAAETEGQLITCGYLDGNANAPRSAQPGFDCRIDTAHGIWGFCPTTVVAATDCGLAAACSDSGTCSSICKFNSGSALTTITCPSTSGKVAYCSTAMLTFGVDQSYAYVACGADPQTQHYVVTPTFTPTPSTSTSSSTTTSSTTSSTSSSSKTSTQNPSSTDGTSTSPDATAKTPASANADSTPSPSPSSGSSTNLGAIIGGVLGGLALLCGSVVAVVFIVRRNRSNSNSTKKGGGSSSSSSSSFVPASFSPSTTPNPPAPPYVPPHLHGMHAGSPPPRPPPAPGLPSQMYPNVYHEADSTAEKYGPSYEHGRGYEGYNAYAVELPSNNNL